MGSVVLYIAVSLDRFVARTDGDISWLEKYEGGQEDYGYTEFYNSVAASIMGSNTYEKALTLAGGIDKKMPTYVITNRLLQTSPGANITLYSGQLSKLVSNIQQKNERNIWLVGGGQLTRSFLKEKLLDQIILSTVPVILGQGISLFENIKQEIFFKLVNTKSYKSGIVQTHYKLVRNS